MSHNINGWLTIKLTVTEKSSVVVEFDFDEQGDSSLEYHITDVKKRKKPAQYEAQIKSTAGDIKGVKLIVQGDS